MKPDPRYIPVYNDPRVDTLPRYMDRWEPRTNWRRVGKVLLIVASLIAVGAML